MKTFLAFTLVLIFSLSLFGVALAADTQLVPTSCDGVDCQLSNLIELVGNIIKFLLFTISIPLAAIMFTWAGVTYVVHSTNSSKRSEAKQMIFNVAIGLAIALAAYLIVNTILDSLAASNYLKQGVGLINYLANYS